MCWVLEFGNVDTEKEVVFVAVSENECKKLLAMCQKVRSAWLEIT